MSAHTEANRVRVHAPEVGLVVRPAELKIEGNEVAALDRLQHLREMGEEVGVRHIDSGLEVGWRFGHGPNHYEQTRKPM